MPGRQHLRRHVAGEVHDGWRWASSTGHPRPPKAFRALRERPEDILPMVKFFIEHYNRKFKRQIEGHAGGTADAAGTRLAG
jgi:hypothetical protein